MPLAKQKGSVNWYVRRAVPRELVEIVGKREVWKSLRTSDKTTATKRSRKIEADIDRIFEGAEAQRRPATVNEVPEDALVRLSRETYRSELGRFDQDIATNPERLLDVLDYEADDLLRGLTTGTWDDHILEEIQERLAKAGYVLKGGPDLRAVQLLARAMVAAYHTASAHASGDWSFSSGDALVTADPMPAGPDAGLTVRELVARHEHDPSRANVGRKSKAQYRTIYAVLQEVAGPNAPVAHVDREVTRRVREKLMERGLAETTLNSYLTLMVAIWEFAIREGYADKNPAKGLRIKAAVHDKDLRLPLSEAQLRRIFTSPEWRAYRTKGPAMYWCPLLSMFMSLRLTEAAQLLRADVKQVEGVWCIAVAPGDTKRVKSRAGHRTIPVHPVLVDLGFLAFVRDVNTPRLFEDVPLSPDGYAGTSLGKRWARLMTRLNANEPRTSYHSLRHNWANACRDAKMADPIMQALGGWSGGGGTASRYGSGFDVKVLAEEIAKIQPLPDGVLDSSQQEERAKHPE